MSDEELNNMSMESGEDKQEDKLKVREMTVLEKKYFDAKVAKHKQNLCKP
jgi:hypothetical protein